jgi:hypothetical protein
VNLKTGKIRLDPSLKGNDRRRVKVHMKTYLARRRAGDSFTKAVKTARKKEHQGLSLKQIRSYEGHLGCLARWHSRENK